VGVRTELVRLLGEKGDAKVIDPLLKILALDQEFALKRVALQTLARFDDETIAKGIIGRYGSTLPAEHGVRSTAERVLAGRLPWAMLMMDEVDKAVIKSRDLGSDIVQLMMEHRDEALTARITKHWPGIAAGAGGIDLAAETARLKTVLAAGKGDASAGKATFVARCANCHQLFGEGALIGPDLTGYERQNPDFWIPSLLNPSLELREGYLNYVASMKDGRKVIGLMVEQSPRTVTLKDLAGQISLLDRTGIDTLEASPISLMPPGLLAGLSDKELQDFFAYLMKP
jgi:putative heme-binding domain-containing protein